MTETSQEEAVPLQISAVLGTFLQKIPIPVDMVGNGYCFQLVPYEEDDGEKSFVIALGITDGNGLQIYWFKDHGIRAFIGAAMQAHQGLLGEVDKLHPIQIANAATLQQTLQQKNFADGKLVLGGK